MSVFRSLAASAGTARERDREIFLLHAALTKKDFAPFFTATYSVQFRSGCDEEVVGWLRLVTQV